MPSLSTHQSASTTKLLFVGDSGSGKTGACASLAKAGYNLRFLDLDNGLDVLKNLLSDPRSPYGKEALERVEFITLTDPMKLLSLGGPARVVPTKATVFQRAIKLLENWDDGNIKHGPLTTWTAKDVLIIDSLTMLSQAALNFVLAANGRLGQQPHQNDWYQGQQLIEGLLQMLYDESVRCNVIVCCHITYIGDDNGPTHGYPLSLGRALPPKIGRYFNSMLMARTTGTGTNLKRKIHTTTIGAVELKNTAPLRVQSDYPLETGLADYFAAIRS